MAVHQYPCYPKSKVRLTVYGTYIVT